MIVSDELKELNSIWQEVMRSFEEDLPVSNVDLWFRPLVIKSFENNTISFECNSPIKTRIINESHIDRIKKGFSEFLGFEPEISVKFVADEKTPSLRNFTTITKKLEEQRPTMPDVDHEVEVGSESFPYHFEYTFENFIVGKTNTFAYAACKGVADNPACLESERLSGGKEIERSPYNPLFIYGPSGLGKTHLLHAIINRIKANIPDVKILYVKCEDFTNQLIDHLSRNAMADFKNKYRKCDVLLIDDIQFLAGKTSTQEEFFHTFNSLYEENKQIILTSDRPPKEIQPLEDRIITRFEWGLLADIQPPDLELRFAIIKKKSEQVGIELPEESLDYLAENLRSNVRQIEGAIKKLAAFKFLSGQKITLDLVKQSVSVYSNGDEPVGVTVDKVFDMVEKAYGVTKAEIMSENRKKEIAYARHIATYLIKELTDMSYPKIAKLMGRKNHSTCISSFNLVDDHLKNDASYAAEVNSLRKEIEKK